MDLKIATVFSACPGSRKRSEGKFSGEEFRDDILASWMAVALANETPITIDLDGAAGYSCGWLEEVFGGFVRNWREPERYIKYMNFKSDEEPELLKEIDDYMRCAFAMRKTEDWVEKLNQNKYE